MAKAIKTEKPYSMMAVPAASYKRLKAHARIRAC